MPLFSASNPRRVHTALFGGRNRSPSHPTPKVEIDVTARSEAEIEALLDDWIANWMRCLGVLEDYVRVTGKGAWTHDMPDWEHHRDAAAIYDLYLEARDVALATAGPEGLDGSKFMDLETPNGAGAFRVDRLARVYTQLVFVPRNGRAPGRDFDADWLDELRSCRDEWDRLAPHTDWSGPSAPNTELLDIALSPAAGHHLGDALRGCTGSKPTKAWLKTAAKMVRSESADQVRAALGAWLATLPVAGGSDARIALWPRIRQYEGLRRDVLSWVAKTGSPRHAATLALFTQHRPFKLYADGSGGFAARPEAADPAHLSDDAERIAIGALWAASRWRDETAIDVIETAARQLFLKVCRKEAGTAFRSRKAGNAALLALGDIGSPAALAAIDRIAAEVDDGHVAKVVAKARAGGC